jgi:hypothetical protein
MAPGATPLPSEKLRPLGVRVAAGGIADVAGALASETQRIANAVRAILN